MKIALLELPSSYLINDKIMPPLGVRYVQSWFEKHNIEAQIFYMNGSIPKADIYGISANTPQFPLAIYYLKEIKKQNPKTTVIIGGIHPTIKPDEAFDAGFDKIVIGDIEKISYTNLFANRFIMEDKFFEYIKPDRSDLHNYNYILFDKKATTLMTSRGCPYSCAFCCKYHKDEKIFYTPMEYISEEIKEIYNLGYRALMIFDDIFIVREDRVRYIGQKLQEYGILWRSFVRADLITENITKMMYECGCREVGMGIESGSLKILKNINKRETPEIISNAIKILKKNNIRVKGFYILGLPGESPETLRETEQFIIDNPIDDYDFVIYKPHPNTPIWNGKDNFDIDWDRIDYNELWYKGKPGQYKSLVWTSMLSKEEITEARNKLEAKFKKW